MRVAADEGAEGGVGGRGRRRRLAPACLRRAPRCRGVHGGKDGHSKRGVPHGPRVRAPPPQQSEQWCGRRLWQAGERRRAGSDTRLAVTLPEPHGQMKRGGGGVRRLLARAAPLRTRASRSITDVGRVLEAVFVAGAVHEDVHVRSDDAAALTNTTDTAVAAPSADADKRKDALSVARSSLYARDRWRRRGSPPVRRIASEEEHTSDVTH